jgi:endonuclease I
MRHINLYFTFIFTLFSCQLASQVLVINELDCDTPGLDNLEFVELKSSIPNFTMNGYTLVFFNGSANGGNASYLALDLDGYTTDINGIFLIGSITVAPFPQFIIPENTIQNGADAVAIYKADAIDFIEGTVAVADQRLVDVLVYGTNDADAITMLDIFKTFKSNISQVNEGSSNNTNSIQRQNDGTYISTTPTPRRPNDGSGVQLNGIRTSFAKTTYREGDVFDITFYAEHPLSNSLNLDFTLNNVGFGTGDYSGQTNVTIAKGESSVSTQITIIQDAFDEGDQNMLFHLSALDTPYLIINNDIKIRVEDDDYRVANFGTPISPTYGRVVSTQPLAYYDGIDRQSGTDLKSSLQTIIADPNVVRAQTYNDVIDILMEADNNPENSNQVWLVYLEKGRSKLDLQFGSDNFGSWNREHTWPRSRGVFYSIEADETFNGKDIYWPTNADSLRHGNSDAHAIRAVDGPENSNRGNQFYGQYKGPAGTLGGFKGDVARCIFYMGVRYNGLEVVRGYPENMVGHFGDLDTLLMWHRNDPPDDFEMNRNNVIYTWQYNRNPFIDMPELVEYIYGDKIGQVWMNPATTSNVSAPTYSIYPNPAHNEIWIDGNTDNISCEIIDIYSRVCDQFNIHAKTKQNLNLTPGIFIIKLKDHTYTSYKQLIIR